MKLHRRQPSAAAQEVLTDLERRSVTEPDDAPDRARYGLTGIDEREILAQMVDGMGSARMEEMIMARITCEQARTAWRNTYIRGQERGEGGEVVFPAAWAGHDCGPHVTTARPIGHTGMGRLPGAAARVEVVAEHLAREASGGDAAVTAEHSDHTWRDARRIALAAL